VLRSLSFFVLGKRFFEAEMTERGRMVNNAGTGGTEAAGKIHEMDEGTWDFVM